MSRESDDHAAAAIPPAASAVLSADLVLTRMSSEMARLRGRMHLLQGHLSTLFDDHPLNAEDMRRLQALDEATQALDDLALSLETAAASLPDGLHLATSELSPCFRLRDLRHRICGDPSPQATENAVDTPDPGQFSWL